MVGLKHNLAFPLLLVPYPDGYYLGQFVPTRTIVLE
jgi:hypothetical protein